MEAIVIRNSAIERVRAATTWAKTNAGPLVFLAGAISLIYSRTAHEEDLDTAQCGPIGCFTSLGKLVPVGLADGLDYCANVTRRFDQNTGTIIFDSSMTYNGVDYCIEWNPDQHRGTATRVGGFCLPATPDVNE